MKTKNRFIILFVIIASISVFSCVEDGDFTVPSSVETKENEALNLILDSITSGELQLKTIQQIKDLFTSGNDPLQIVSNIVVKGYVVSSDKTGNFYQEFYMQDAAENPTAGIKIALNLGKNYNKFNIGREVYIRLKGLFIGETNSGDGVTAIGGKIKPTDIREIENLSVNQIANHLFRSNITENIVPKLMTLGGVSKSDIGTFVKIENAFFPTNLVGKTYIDPNDDFDTQRIIKACQGIGNVDLLIETSSFASFANESLPSGGGFINAVVSKDFGGDFTVLVLNNTKDVQMEEERCTPLSITDFPILLLDENFDATSGDISIMDWINFIEAGTKPWKSYVDSSSGSRAARIGSFFSNNDSTITWLITKGINLDTTTQEFLSFETSNSFGDGSELEVLISTNWNGQATSITTAMWDYLPGRIVANSDNFERWVHSTYIDLSNYSGTAHIAFKYTGSGNENFDGTYELDNIIINAK